MIDFTGIHHHMLKRLETHNKKSVIVQKGPRLFSLETISFLQGLSISIKKVKLSSRPGSVFNSSQRVRITSTPKSINQQEPNVKNYFKRNQNKSFLKDYTEKQEPEYDQNPFQNKRLKTQRLECRIFPKKL